MTDLRRHIPPVALTWDDESPGRLWRAEDATLVFADISGFTALTERLTARGRIGAEEIVETLNRVFAPMLDGAQARGGQLLKFGGDALFFLFRGDGHAEQACDAVVEMRAALRAAAEPTSVGRLRLSMSVGMHSGEILLFLVGQPSRELLVLGPAATATARAESAASAGQTLLTAGAARRLPRDAVRDGPDGLYVLRRRTVRTAPNSPLTAPHASPDRLASLFPARLGPYLDARVPDPEHRIGCIAFARFGGTDAVLSEQGPDALAHTLHDLVTAVEAAVAPEGVTLLATDLDADGGKFFLASGVPHGGPDDSGAMLRAMRTVALRGTPLPLQIGVNRGHVFAAEVGTATRAAYSAMGDTTNTAARIMGKAARGTVLVHPTVLEHARTRFEATPVGPLTLKGKKAPLTAYAVGEETGSRQAGPDTRLPFVGRSQEVAAFASTLATARAGRGRSVVVVGGPGVGKSRLAGHVLRRDDVRVLELRAEPYGRSSAYRVLRDPLRHLLGISRADPRTMGASLLTWLQRELPDLLPLAPLLADVAQVAVPPTPQADAIDTRFRPQRTADLVVEVLQRALPGPLAIVVEEAQWADEASAQLLSTAAMSTRELPWVVLAVRRDEDGGFLPPAAQTIRLGPLSPQESRQLVLAATEATPLRPHEIDEIVTRADGNPMFIEEATRIVAEGGSAQNLPDSVQSVMGAQIDMLEPLERATLRRASVLGRSFRREVLRATLERDELNVDGATLARLGEYLADDGPDRLVFRNSLIRDAAYEGLAYRMRARLHRAAGLAVESLSTDPDADAATLSLHFWTAGDHRRTWDYARRAADVAGRAYANTDAAAHYERALEASRHLPEVDDEHRAGIWAELGRLRDLAGMLPQSVEAYKRAERLVATATLRADLMARRARVEERSGNYRSALLAVTGARNLIGDDPSPDADAVRIRLDTLTSLIRLGQEKPEEARVWALRAVSAPRAEQDPETLVQALMAVDFADAELGRPGVGEHTRRALRICVEHGFRPRESVARANLGAFAFYEGRWDEAVEWYETSRRVAEEAGNAYGAAESDLSMAEILINQGRLAQAHEILVPAIRTVRVSGLDDAVAYGRMELARVHLGLEQIDEARDLARDAVDAFTAMQHPSSAFEARVVLAEVALRSGEPGEALDLLDAVGEQVGSLRARAQWVRCRAKLSLGQVADAAAAVTDGLRAADEQGVQYERALLLQARGELPGGTADDAARARAVLDALGVRSLA